MVVVLLALLMGLAGCAGNPSVSSTESTVPTATDTQEEPLITELTWQEAKAHTQAMELEIAALIPNNTIVSIDQKETGMLLSCNSTHHKWKGSTTITVVEGTNIKPIVKDIEAHYRAKGTKVSADRNVDEDYRIQIDLGAGENYIVAEGLAPNEIRIASGSVCFTLPEGIYPGGDF
ncbi:hypothetical protein FQP90_05675 [Paenarthrobacter nitroguajacolicus]|uniref:Uncharacterized protein n=1 Tax=Paenarthrobacter nitroguajacolicus TaxID=211146 RepID=A0A558H991_PAENT|nr:hypothetical protein [Paenarthrobacter nitroguajacolicus]TVU65680.1 hypothetical protein FQP90_05675 [Paenarthrobacter nitroguajacolicus]